MDGINGLQNKWKIEIETKKEKKIKSSEDTANKK